MADEKQVEKKEGSKNAFSAIFKVVLGLIFLALGLWAIVAWWSDLVTVIKGCVGGFLILAGVITLAIAKD
jgi:hypothetical protein